MKTLLLEWNLPLSPTRYGKGLPKSRGPSGVYGEVNVLGGHGWRKMPAVAERKLGVLEERAGTLLCVHRRVCVQGLPQPDSGHLRSTSRVPFLHTRGSLKNPQTDPRLPGWVSGNVLRPLRAGERVCSGYASRRERFRFAVLESPASLQGVSRDLMPLR